MDPGIMESQQVRFLILMFQNRDPKVILGNVSIV